MATDIVTMRQDYLNRQSYWFAKTYIVREKFGGVFGQAGDSGSPVGLEDGRAGGIYLGGGSGKFDESEEIFHFSIVADLTQTFAQIKACTGRDLEIASEVDLTTSDKRAKYHYERTGKKREREYK